MKALCLSALLIMGMFAVMRGTAGDYEPEVFAIQSGSGSGDFSRADMSLDVFDEATPNEFFNDERKMDFMEQRRPGEALF